MVLIKETSKIHGHVVHNTQSLAGYEQWVDLVKDKTDTTIYRGQRKDYPLLPNICREGEPSLLLVKERELLTQFKNKAARCLQVVPDNDSDWLVVAQHHGLHTRLIDWSHDPYAALWFALDGSNKKDSRPEVWVMNPLKQDVMQNLDSSRPFSGERTKVFKPSFSIPRLVAQDGCFVLFKHVENSKKGFVALERNQQLRKRIERVRIQNHAAPQIMKQLKAMGYDRDRLFPDIDAIAKSVQAQVLSNSVP